MRRGRRTRYFAGIRGHMHARLQPQAAWQYLFPDRPHNRHIRECPKARTFLARKKIPNRSSSLSSFIDPPHRCDQQPRLVQPSSVSRSPQRQSARRCALRRRARAARIVEQGAEDDRRAAMALQNGGTLPAQSNAWKPLLQ